MTQKKKILSKTIEYTGEIVSVDKKDNKFHVVVDRIGNDDPPMGMTFDIAIILKQDRHNIKKGKKFLYIISFSLPGKKAAGSAPSNV